jgi:hypothetical protein
LDFIILGEFGYLDVSKPKFQERLAVIAVDGTCITNAADR